MVPSRTGSQFDSKKNGSRSKIFRYFLLCLFTGEREKEQFKMMEINNKKKQKKKEKNSSTENVWSSYHRTCWLKTHTHNRIERIRVRFLIGGAADRLARSRSADHKNSNFEKEEESSFYTKKYLDLYCSTIVITVRKPTSSPVWIHLLELNLILSCLESAH